MTVSSKPLRDGMRFAHFVAAFATCAFVYSPFAGEEGFAAIMRGVVIPVLVATGLGMWQVSKLRRLFARRP